MLFQFQCGAIDRMTYIQQIMSYLSFNSSVVRLIVIDRVETEFANWGFNSSVVRLIAM